MDTQKTYYGLIIIKYTYSIIKLYIIRSIYYNFITNFSFIDPFSSSLVGIFGGLVGEFLCWLVFGAFLLLVDKPFFRGPAN